ncbi:MAG: tRNA (guanosine(37)-N1)-methyltransferase TrmD [Pseudomonadota bacterium]
MSIFPELLAAAADFGIVGRALRDELATMACFNPRDHAVDRHGSVDDRPYGGGPGMVMQFAPMVAAIRAAKAASEAAHVVLMSPQGQQLTQARAAAMARRPELVLVAGRYEGVDERIVDAEIDEEVSLGDFVMTGGEIAAQAMLDATVRLLPGVLGNAESAVEESHSAGLLEHPQYTRPAVWEGREIPAVLTSGDHGKVADWRRAQSEALTRARRPDLWARHTGEES